jgi:uncharacterized membrane protein YfcA
MIYFVIGITALLSSLLTFFSGFGLGTILTPVFILFFPTEIAIALTGIVHLLNNIFKAALTGRNINPSVFFRFGIPSIIAAFAGAYILLQLQNTVPLHTYYIGEKECNITSVKLVVSLLMIFFSFADISPCIINLKINKNTNLIGGLFSGFFGGISGHQGALRAIFLIKSGLSKESFIATGVAIGCLVDLTRLPVYFSNFSTSLLADNLLLISCATLCAFAGAVVGNSLLKKVTLPFMQKLVAVLIIFLSLALGAGII